MKLSLHHSHEYHLRQLGPGYPQKVKTYPQKVKTYKHALCISIDVDIDIHLYISIVSHLDL